MDNIARKKSTNNGLYVRGLYTKVPDGLWLSKEFNSLKATSRCIYMVMLAFFDPFKPDVEFALPYSEVKDITGFNANTFSNAIKELMTNGFIKIPHRGRYPRNVTLYKIDTEPLQRDYPKHKRGQGTLPDYLTEIKRSIE